MVLPIAIDHIITFSQLDKHTYLNKHSITHLLNEHTDSCHNTGTRSFIIHLSEIPETEVGRENSDL